MKELPYFKMDPGEFLGDDIAVASNTAIGIFTRFLMKAWMSDGYLKNDDLLQRKLNVCSTDDEQALKFLLDHKIIKQKDDRLYVKFQILQIEEYMAGLLQKSQAGKASAKKRAAKILHNISLKNSTVVERSLNSRCNETSTDVGLVFQRKSTKEKEIEKEKEIDKEIYKESIKKSVSLLFHRKENTKWTDKENQQLTVISKRPGVESEFKEIRTLYESGYKYRRHDIITFLNNWSGELDRARNYKGEESNKPAQAHILPPKDRTEEYNESGKDMKLL